MPLLYRYVQELKNEDMDSLAGRTGDRGTAARRTREPTGRTGQCDDRWRRAPGGCGKRQAHPAARTDRQPRHARHDHGVPGVAAGTDAGAQSGRHGEISCREHRRYPDRHRDPACAIADKDGPGESPGPSRHEVSRIRISRSFVLDWKWTMPSPRNIQYWDIF